MTATYKYSMSPAKIDEYGIWRDTAVRDITEEKLAAIELACDFQGAMDLEDGVEFARGYDVDGKPVNLYRWEE